MRRAFTLYGVSLVAVALASVALAAPHPNNAHGTGAGVGQGANFSAENGGGASDPLFALLDTDGDGVISAKELKRAIIVLKELDTNKDGSISWEEVLAASKGGPAASAVGAGPGDPPQGAGTGFAGGGAAGGGEESQAFKRFMQYDKNGDGKLSADELPPQMAGLLRNADLNHDGFIDARELEIAVKQMGDRMKAGMVGGQQGPGMTGRMPGGNPANGGKGP
jgi:Ca2+-binding EF-hand superfamily protein